MTVSDLTAVYRRLLDCFAPQGWWPLSSMVGRGCFDDHGYHRGDFSYPRTAEQRFEIAVGAVLTQNTTWRNAESVIKKLIDRKLMTPEAILSCPSAELGRHIITSGYYNQKARKLIALAEFFAGEGSVDGLKWKPQRQDFLNLWGIGPETADSILLYAYKIPCFVVDAYTRRLLSRLGIAGGWESYDQLQSMLAGSLPCDHELYAEFHALIVRQAKVYCSKKPSCVDCSLRSGCNHFAAGQNEN